MGLSTLVAGLDHSTFLVDATGTRAAVASPSPSRLDSAVRAEFAAVALPDSATGAQASSEFNTSFRHRKVDAWIQKLTTSLRGDFAQSLERMDKYSVMITRKLDSRDMPRELIYLAMIESNFNPTARSRVGAVGMWQFMSATARSLGLRVRGRTDERKNPEEATDAALTYLSELHERFGSWYLAAAAYNSGAGTVSKALRKVTGKKQGTDEDFFRILSALPRETQEYVPKLIAAAKVGSDPEQYGITE
jgi:membrane-bound lytic murein transglycosylase D